MVILDIDDHLFLFQLCDGTDKADAVCLWGPTSIYSDYDYYFIREPIDA